MFERGAVSYGNHIKMVKFEQGVRELQKDLKDPINDFEDYKRVANYINVFSGRAGLGKAEMISKDASLFIFSLRNAVSQVQQLNPYFYYKLGNPKEMAKGKASVAQKMAVKSFMTSVIAITAFQVAVLGLANSGKDDDEEKWKMETDPRSSDFMKLRRGNTTFDMWHGLNGLVVLYSRIFSQQTKSSKDNEVKDLGKGFGAPTTSDLLVNYATNKLSPSAGYFWRLGNTHKEVDEKTGKSYRVDKYGNVYGQRETLDLFVPIYWGAINDIRKEDPDAYQAFLVSMGLLGMSVGAQTQGIKYKEIIGESGQGERKERSERKERKER